MVVKIEKTTYKLKCSYCDNTIVVDSNNDKINENIEGWKLKFDYKYIKLEDRIIDIKCPNCIEYERLYNSDKMFERVRTLYYEDPGHFFYKDICKEFGLENDSRKKRFVDLIIDHTGNWNSKYYYAERIAQIMIIPSFNR